jgi:hypothetical protein
MKRIIPLVLVFTALGLGVFGYSEHQRAKLLAGEVGQLKEQVAQLEAQVKKLTDEAASAARKNEILAAESASLRKKLREAAVAEPSGQVADNPTDRPRSRDERDGRGRGGAQGMMRRVFGDVITKMNLSEEDQNKLSELLAARGQSASDIVRQAAQNGQTDPAALVAAIKAKNAENDQQISALLGSQYAEFKAVQDSASDRNVLGRFNEQMTQSGSTLQDYQSTALNQVMSEERLKTQSGVMGAVGYFDPRVAAALPKSEVDSYIASQQQYYDNVLNRASGVLTPDQQKALSDSFSRSIQGMQRGAEWSRRRAQGGGPQPPGQ